MTSRKKNKSLKKTLQLSFILIIGIMIIPSIYSIFVLQIHTKQYDAIIINVNEANKINNIIKQDIPNELWEIVCGKKTFSQGEQYIKLKTVFTGITEMQNTSSNKTHIEKLEVAFRTCTTLSRNINKLQDQIEKGTSVTENEQLLDEIRTITVLFSDVMQEFIISEIESANITNMAIRRSTVVLSILQISIIIFSLFFSIKGYFTVSKSFTEPLDNMKNLSTEISKGNLQARTEIPDIEELSPLANTLNSMAEQIDLLIKKNIEEQKNFQKAEVKALQAQITPHFLYNTFDTIIWLAEEEDTERVVKITKAFSDFLRISLSKGHEWITLKQELDHITNYLTIQKIRYADILNYEINVNPDLLSCKMIKLVLQPLVENAIYHGIKNKRGRGHIFVNIDYTDQSKQFINLSVSDDGAGFTEERLEEVNKELNTGYENTEKLNSVYGLYNVHKKLCLYYGDKTEGLKIQSVYKQGSTISFVIPFMSGENDV